MCVCVRQSFGFLFLTSLLSEKRPTDMTHHGLAVGPPEVSLKHLIAQPDPLVISTQTCRIKSGLDQWEMTGKLVSHSR